MKCDEILFSAPVFFQMMEEEVLKYYVNNIPNKNGGTRRSVIAKVNEMVAKSEIISDDVFVNSFSARGVATIKLLSSLVEGPTNCVVVNQFHAHLERAGGDLYFDVLVDELLGEMDQKVMLEICRLMQSVSQIGRVSHFSDLYRNKLLAILSSDNVRDLITQAGYLLCLHFPSDRFDHADLSPIPRMSIMRAKLSLEFPGTTNFGEGVDFFAFFSSDSAQIHYGLQSISLLLTQVVRNKSSAGVEDQVLMRVVDLCLLRWDHPWQMVTASCRSLYGLVCEIADCKMRKSILSTRIACLDESSKKKKFNCLFSMVPFEEDLPVDMSEILNAIKVSSSSIAAASQLLEAVLQRRPKSSVDRIARHILDGCGTDVDLEQVFRAVSRAGGICMQLLVSEIQKSGKNCSKKLQLQILRHLTTAGSGSLELFMTREEIMSCIKSCESELVTLAAIVSLEFGLIEELEAFLLNGGVAVVGCCNDDRSVLLKEFIEYFTFRDDPALFRHVWQEGTRPGALQEEAQLLLEIIAGLDKQRVSQLVSGEREEFADRMMRFGLTSKWRKLRSACTWFDWVEGVDIARNLMKSRCMQNEELEAVVVNLLAIHDPAIVPLESLSHASLDAIKILVPSGERNDVISVLLTNIVIASTFLGENCVDDILQLFSRNKGGSIRISSEKIRKSEFKGSVDCRGHSVFLDGESGRNSKTGEMWSLGKKSALTLKSLLLCSAADPVDPIIARSLAILLLALKHPAVILPVNEAFSASLARLTWLEIKEQILEPLLDCISGGGSFPLPLALRRSQGLGPLIAGVIKCCPSLASSLVFPRLLQSIETAERDDEPTLHALNVLRCIVRDSSVSDKIMDMYSGKIVGCAISILTRLSFDFWRIRSAATQLFVQASRRMVGTDNEEDWLACGGRVGNRSRKTVTGLDFFFNRTGSGNEFLSEIIQLLKNSKKQDNEFILVPILSVLQSLSMTSKLGSEFVSEIENGLKNRSAHVRKLSAKILARMIFEQNDDAANRSVEENNLNQLHGELVLVNYLRRLGRKAGRTVGLSTDAVYPEIIRNEMMQYLLNEEKGVEKIQEIYNQEQIDQFLLSQGGNSDLSLPKAKLILSNPHPELPVHRDLLVACMHAHPSLITPEHIAEWQTVWSACSPLFVSGIAALTSFIHMDILSEINFGDDSVEEEVKIVVAKSGFVRNRFPHIHVLLLLDESPNVRLAASLDGLNSYWSLKSTSGLLEKCESGFLLSLINEPFAGTPVENHGLRYFARNLARDVLRERNVVVVTKAENSPDEQLTQENWDKMHSKLLLNSLC